MANPHILVVEDEVKIAALLDDYLRSANFTTTLLHHGNQVIPFVKKSPPDLMLLDIMLPGTDGLEICRSLRKFSDIPVIMITARVEEIDMILGLELGADDYICKPFSPREVLARVKAVLRRMRASTVDDKLMVGAITLDNASRQVTVGGNLLTLTPSEFGLLKVLMASPSRVFSRNELLNQVQSCSFEGYDRTIDSHIKNLRKKVAVFLPDREVIRSVYGVGYCFGLER
ncbi:MAG: response regulator [Desulfosalsimonadaceae bacterium]|nr:response regulator [Desulfosalsimonadaceae bacterium]